MTSPFDRLRTEFSSLAGLPCSHSAADEYGTLISVLDFRGTRVELLGESEGFGRIFSRVLLGSAESYPDSNVWGDLLEANFIMIGTEGPLFSRDPWSGDAVAQQTWLADTTAQALLDSVARQCELAEGWKRGQLAEMAGAQNGSLFTDDAADVESDEGRAAALSFNALCDDLRRICSLPDLSIQSAPGIACFALAAKGREVQVCHLSQQPAAVHIVVNLGNEDDAPAGRAQELAEANAWLLAEKRASIICRRTLTREYVLRSTLPLDGELSAERLLREIHSQAAAALAGGRDLAERSAPGASISPTPFSHFA
jgi:hypothetical protein